MIDGFDVFVALVIGLVVGGLFGLNIETTSEYEREKIICEYEGGTFVDSETCLDSDKKITINIESP